MSLVKVSRLELANAYQLFRLKLRDSQRGIVAVLVFMFALATLNAASAWQGFASSTDMLSSQNFLDYSALLLILAPAAIAYIFWQEAAGKNAIYPQTSMSRFLSTQMLSLFFVLLALVSVLVLNLIVHLSFSLISNWVPNLIMGYSFSPAFLASGFVAAFVFLLVVTAGFAFLTELVKAFRLYAIVPLVAFIIFVQFYHLTPLFPFDDTLAGIHALFTGLIWRFLHPASLVSFVAICLLASAILLSLGIILRHFNAHGRDTNKNSLLFTFAYVPVIALILVMGFDLYFDDSLHLSPDSAIAVFPAEPVTITVDAQLVPEGSPVYVLTQSIHRDRMNVDESSVVVISSEEDVINSVFTFSQMRLTAFEEHGFSPLQHWSDIYAAREVDELGVESKRSAFTGDKIVVEYKPASFNKGSARLQNLVSPEISAHLQVWAPEDGSFAQDTLVVQHSYTGEGKVLFVPIWSMLGLIGENAQNARPNIVISAQ
ncbi:MAG: hypothetical protein FWE46_02065 [Coriobacteriia bacterium]|nr:hypothetical protein [Coriobacteriia bacterium]MCL2537803.1 hypothetical protein [Coriobacteriia bacterium]